MDTDAEFTYSHILYIIHNIYYYFQTLACILLVSSLASPIANTVCWIYYVYIMYNTLLCHVCCAPVIDKAKCNGRSIWWYQLSLLHRLAASVGIVRGHATIIVCP